MVNYTEYLEKVIDAAQVYGIRAYFVDEMPTGIRPTPVRGAFRMGEVLLPKSNPEEALFVLLHGLGHMAQWTEYPGEYERSYAFNSKSNAWDEDSLREVWDHEWSALPFVLGFLKQNHLNTLCDWYVCYFIADQYYLGEIFHDHQYDLRKFHTILGKVKNLDLEEVYKSASFPMLSLKLRKEAYILII